MKDYKEQRISKKEIVLQIGNLALGVAVLAGVLPLFWIFGTRRLGDIGLANVSIEVVALVVSFTLLLSCMLERSQRGEERKWFMVLLSTNHLILGVDIVSYFLEGNPANRTSLTIWMCIAYILDFLMAYLFLQFITTALNVRDRKAVKIISGCACVLAVVFAALTPVNLFTTFYYYVDATGVYHRADFYFIQPLYTMMITWAVLAFVILYWGEIRRNAVFAALGYVVVVEALIISTLIYTRLYIIYAANVLICLVLYIIFNLESGNRSAVTEKELSTAKMIQRSMLPDIFPDFVNVPEFELFTLMSPAREVGGGFFDFFMRDEKHFVFLIGDVSVQGVGAALFMAVAKSMINMRAAVGGRPSEILGDVNERIVESGEGNVVAGIWLGILNTETGHLIYSNAGHNAPAVCRTGADDRFTIVEAKAGPPVGERKQADYWDEESTLYPGDKVFLYNDGIFETRGKNGVSFGREKLLRELNVNREKSNQKLCQEVEQALEQFLAGEPQVDDVTMLYLTFKAYRETKRAEKEQA